MKEKLIKSYKVRIYPNQNQKELISKHIGCCRFVWNEMLACNMAYYDLTGKFFWNYDMNYLLTSMKQLGKYDFLNEVSVSSLQKICGDLDKAIKKKCKQFQGTSKGFPKFKSKKKSKQSFPCRSDRFYFTSQNEVKIEKLGKVKFKSDFYFPEGKEFKFTNPRIEITAKGKYMLSFGMEYENQVNQPNDFTIGVDLGIKETATIYYSGNYKFYHNINKSKKIRELNSRIKHTQRSISRKYHQNRSFEKTQNIIQEEQKLRLLFDRLKNIRENYNHQLTAEIIKLNPKRIIVEDLNVSGMMKNKHLSKAIQEQNFYRILQMLEYKCKFNNIELVKADRFYPSSKTCSKCGHVRKELKLSDRIYKCPECENEIDRDLNAAINLSRYCD